MENHSLLEGLRRFCFILEQGRSVRGPPPEEEGAAVLTRDELAANVISHPSAPLVGKRQRKS